MDEIRRYIASQSADVPLTGPVLTLTQSACCASRPASAASLEVRIPKLLQRNAENDAALKLLAKDVSATRKPQDEAKRFQQAFALTAKTTLAIGTMEPRDMDWTSVLYCAGHATRVLLK